MFQAANERRMSVPQASACVQVDAVKWAEMTHEASHLDQGGEILKRILPGSNMWLESS
jgi:hypothetical protein